MAAPLQHVPCLPLIPHPPPQEPGNYWCARCSRPGCIDCVVSQQWQAQPTFWQPLWCSQPCHWRWGAASRYMKAAASCLLSAAYFHLLPRSCFTPPLPHPTHAGLSSREQGLPQRAVLHWQLPVSRWATTLLGCEWVLLGGCCLGTCICMPPVSTRRPPCLLGVSVTCISVRSHAGCHWRDSNSRWMIVVAVEDKPRPASVPTPSTHTTPVAGFVYKTGACLPCDQMISGCATCQRCVLGASAAFNRMCHSGAQCLACRGAWTAAGDGTARCVRTLYGSW